MLDQAYEISLHLFFWKRDSWGVAMKYNATIVAEQG
jgi:hypothetical protein